MEKVTAFILRPAKGRKIEILIFRHPNAGLQLPAGTVEPGEAPETAVLREVETHPYTVEVTRRGRVVAVVAAPQQRPGGADLGQHRPVGGLHRLGRDQ